MTESAAVLTRAGLVAAAVPELVQAVLAEFAGG
jgi:hypothetical protein